MATFPTAVTPSFPSTSEPYNGDFFCWLHERSDIFWKQTDYGGYVARVTKKQFPEFIDFGNGAAPSCRGTRNTPQRKKKPYRVHDPKQIRDYVILLSDAKESGLVAEEW